MLRWDPCSFCYWPFSFSFCVFFLVSNFTNTSIHVENINITHNLLMLKIEVYHLTFSIVIVCILFVVDASVAGGEGVGDIQSKLESYFDDVKFCAALKHVVRNISWAMLPMKAMITTLMAFFCFLIKFASNIGLGGDIAPMVVFSWRLFITWCQQHFISTAANECHNMTNTLLLIRDVEFASNIGLGGDIAPVVFSCWLFGNGLKAITSPWARQPNNTKHTILFHCEVCNVVKKIDVEISLCL